MKRCIVRSKEDYVNIAADELREENGMVYVTKGGALVGVFDLGTVDYVYLSGGRVNEPLDE